MQRQQQTISKKDYKILICRESRLACVVCVSCVCRVCVGGGGGVKMGAGKRRIMGWGGLY